MLAYEVEAGLQLSNLQHTNKPVASAKALVALPTGCRRVFGGRNGGIWGSQPSQRTVKTTSLVVKSFGPQGDWFIN